MSAADIGQIRDVLITATEDFDPIGGKALQTTDQDQGKKFLRFKFVCLLGHKKLTVYLCLICCEVKCVTTKK